MSDTSPRDQHALRYNAAKPAARAPQPGEVLFEFPAAGQRRGRCELRDQTRQGGGFDVQFFSDELLLLSRRFLDRQEAEHWAAAERAALAPKAPTRTPDGGPR